MHQSADCNMFLVSAFGEGETARYTLCNPSLPSVKDFTMNSKHLGPGHTMLLWLVRAFGLHRLGLARVCSCSHCARPCKIPDSATF